MQNTPINAVIGKTLPAIIFNIGIPPNYLLVYSFLSHNYLVYHGFKILQFLFS